MLIFTRKINESFVIGDNIIVKVVSIGESTVKIGIEAPKEIAIHRQEKLGDNNEKKA